MNIYFNLYDEQVIVSAFEHAGVAPTSGNRRQLRRSLSAAFQAQLQEEANCLADDLAAEQRALKYAEAPRAESGGMSEFEADSPMAAEELFWQGGLNSPVPILDLTSTRTAARIEQMAAFMGLRPKKIQTLNVAPGGHQTWIEDRCAIHFYDTAQENYRANFVGFSFVGQPQVAYQIALNILHDQSLQEQVGVRLS